MDRLRQLRKECKITQELLGYELGISQQNISRYENDIRTLPVDMLIKFTTYYKVSSDYLLGISSIKSFPKLKRNLDTKISGEITFIISSYLGLPSSTRKILLELIQTISAKKM